MNHWPDRVLESDFVTGLGIYPLLWARGGSWPIVLAACIVQIPWTVIVALPWMLLVILPCLFLSLLCMLKDG